MTQHRHIIPKGANQTASVTDPDLSPYAKTTALAGYATTASVATILNPDPKVVGSMANVLLRLAAVEAHFTPPPVVVPVQTAVTVAAGGKGVTVTRDGQIIENLLITGPGCATYDGATFGIFGGGTFRDVVIRHCTISGLAHSGAWLEGLINPIIEDCVIEDVAYSGIMVVGVVGGRASRNTVRRVGVTGHQQDSNAYGIAVSGQATPSSDFIVEDNLVTDIPLWHGLDTHGGQRIIFRRNTVRRVPRAIFLTTDPGQATGCSVIGNLFTEPAPLTGGGTNPVAITTYKTANCSFTGNAIGAAYGAPTVYDYIGGDGIGSTGLVQSGNVTGEALP